MADDPKSGTGEGESGAASASGTPPASGGEAETSEQKIARLEAERDAANKKFQDSEALRLSQLTKVEEANRMQREGSGANTTDRRTADPLSQEIADLEETIRALAAEGKRDVVAESLYRERMREKQQRADRELFDRAMRDAEPVFAALSDKELAARAKELYSSGSFRSPDLAIAAAKGERYDNAESERQRLARVAAEREEDLKRRANGAPGIPPSAGGGVKEQRTTMNFSEFDRITKADPNGEGRRLVAQRDSGKLVLNMSG